MGNTLKYYKENCEENYITTPISVLRYISELEENNFQLTKQRDELKDLLERSTSIYKEDCDLDIWYEKKKSELLTKTKHNE